MPAVKKKPPVLECGDPSRPCPAEGVAERIHELSETLAVHAAKMEATIEKIEVLVDKAGHALFGNGSPGILIRLDRLEQNEEERSKKQETARKLGIGVIVAIAGQAFLTVAAFLWILIKSLIADGVL